VLPSDLCPSCLMPFDKNRKRRLIDSCGHERCYACLFSSELCPLCSPGIDNNNNNNLNSIKLKKNLHHPPGGRCESRK
jgi:hypothetical protein